eukprot:2700341-Amphidinium_carterae.1
MQLEMHAHARWNWFAVFRLLVCTDLLRVFCVRSQGLWTYRPGVLLCTSSCKTRTSCASCEFGRGSACEEPRMVLASTRAADSELASSSLEARYVMISLSVVAEL